MILLTILSALGSLASLIALGFYLFHNDATKKAYVLLGLLVIFALATGVLSVKVYQLSEKNKSLISARVEAQELLKKWNLPKDFSLVSRGEARGVILSGLAFLETHKNLFPDTYSKAQQVFDTLGVSENRDEEWWNEIGQLQQAAETMHIIILSIQIKPEYGS